MVVDVEAAGRAHRDRTRPGTGGLNSVSALHNADVCMDIGPARAFLSNFLAAVKGR